MANWILAIDGKQTAYPSQATAFTAGFAAGVSGEGVLVTVSGEGDTWRYVGMGKGDHPSGQPARAKDRGAWRMEKR